MASILVLGNHPEERDGLALVLEFAGHHCATVGSYSEAKNLLRQEAYDLVLADSLLGENSSEQIVRKLKNASPGVAVLVLTEDADRGDAGDEAITFPYSPVQNLSPQMFEIQKSEALVLLLPEQESSRLLSNIPQTAGMLNKLAALYHSQENYAVAERLYKRALKVSKKKAGDQHREAATILNNLASLYHDQERYSKAESLYKQSLAIVEKVFGPNHPKVATRLRNLMDLYRVQGRKKEAASLDKRLKYI